MSYAKKQYRFKQHYLINEMKRKEVTKNGRVLQVAKRKEKEIDDARS